MTMKKPGLGKKNSLDVLLSFGGMNAVPHSLQSIIPNEKLNSLPVHQLQRGQYQPRRHIAPEALQELADSIKAQGIIQPIIVRGLAEKDRYEIIAGERRWRAAQLAGLDTVPVVIKTISDQAALAMALIENIQRQDLNPIEEAVALQRLLDEFTMTHQEVATAVGKSRVTVSNLLRLLQLTEETKHLLIEGKIELGHAKVLLALQGSDQSRLAKIVAMRGLTVRETEKLVKNSQSMRSEQTNEKPKSNLSSDLLDLESSLADKLGTVVKLNHQETGKGKLSIHYGNIDELKTILTHFFN